MRRTILATLATGSLLVGTGSALAECQTLAQARAQNSAAHLAYRVVGSMHCWFAGMPVRRGLPLAKKKVERLVQESTADQSDETSTAQAPPDPPNKLEPEATAPPFDRLENSEDGRRITEAFRAVEVGINSLQALQRNLGLSDGDVEISATPQPQRQRSPPVETLASAPVVVVWLVLTIGIGTIIMTCLKLHRSRLSAWSPRHFEAPHPGQDERMRNDASVGMPFVGVVDAPLTSRETFSSEVPSRGARRRHTSTDWNLASLLHRHG